MPTIADAIARILPSFRKDDVREKIRNTTKKFNDIVRPEVSAFSDGIRERELKSTYGKNFTKNILPIVPQRLRNDPQPYSRAVEMVTDNAVKILDQLDQYVKANMGDSVHKEGITYQKASVLRLVEILDFFTDYTSRHLSMLVAKETDISVYNKPDGNPFTPDAARWLENNFQSYLKALVLLSQDPKKLLADIGKIPEIQVIGTDVSEVPALTGGSGDPLHLGAIPFISTIFVWNGMRGVDRDIEAFEAAKKEKSIIEMRLEALHQIRGGNPDAQTQTIINGYERELTIVRQKLKDYEVSDK